MKQLPELLAIAKTRLAAEEERIAEWVSLVQSDLDWALVRAEDVVAHVERRKVWTDVIRCINASDRTPEQWLESARLCVRLTLGREWGGKDALHRTREHACAAAWQEVVNAIVEP